MSVETPRSSAGLATPLSFEDFIQDDDDFQNFCDWSDEASSSETDEKLQPRDYKLNMIAKLVSECTNCEKCKKETIRRISLLEERFLEESMAKHRQMQIMVEYEKQIRKWFAEKNAMIRELKREKQEAEIERLNSLDELKIVTKYFADLEQSYQELFKKYEQSKNTVEILTSNIEILQENLIKFEESVNQKQIKYDQLKEYAEEKLNEANLELDSAMKKFTSENWKLREKSKAKIQELTEMLEQKNQENAELASICDFLLQSYKEKDCSFEDLNTYLSDNFFEGHNN